MPGKGLRFFTVNENMDLLDIFKVLRERVDDGVDRKDFIPRRALSVSPRGGRGQINIRGAGGVKIEGIEPQSVQHTGPNNARAREKRGHCFPRLRRRIRLPPDAGGFRRKHPA